MPLPFLIASLSLLLYVLLNNIDIIKQNFHLTLNKKLELIAESSFTETIEKRNRRYYSYSRTITKSHTNKIIFDQDKQIVKVECGCKAFKKGPRNISAPCKHILALYIIAVKFLDLPLERGTKYTIKQMEDLKLNE